MTQQPQFEGFPKMGRLKRNCIITEKLDGSNAQVFIQRLADFEVMPTDTPIVAVVGDLLLYAGSRNRWVTPGKANDNYGWAGFVQRNAEDLAKLGEGRHFGEWWGAGIQRAYGLTGSDKRFSLFNVNRWSDPERRPTCCGIVPILYNGPFSDEGINGTLEKLRVEGSTAVPGFMNPEGMIVFHPPTSTSFKVTLKDDHLPKSLAEAA